MHSRTSRVRLALPLAVAMATLVPATAEAAAGLYLQLGVGYAAFQGTKLVMVEQPVAGDIPIDSSDDACCAGPGLGMQLRLGFSVFGFGGPEFFFVGNGFNGFSGGAGYVGGGIRAFPLKFLSLTGLDTSELPIDMGIGLGFGYTITGQDFAYTGSGWDLDFHIEYKLASFLSAGIKLDILFANYGNFAFTSFKNDKGRCLEGINQDLGRGIIDASDRDAQCQGDGPSTTLLTPQLIFTFHFDILDL